MWREKFPVHLQGIKLCSQLHYWPPLHPRVSYVKSIVSQEFWDYKSELSLILWLVHTTGNYSQIFGTACSSKGRILNATSAVKKGKIICLIKHHTMKTYWGSGVIAAHILNLALGIGDWSASLPGCFIPGVRAPGTHWIGGWFHKMKSNVDTGESVIILPNSHIKCFMGFPYFHHFLGLLRVDIIP